jgi:nucleotide-binding universal stress UspA family protein
MATDGSRHALEALATACRILAPDNRDVDVMYVAPAARGKPGAHHEKLRRRAERILEAARTTLAAEGVSARTIPKCGSAVGTLIGNSQNYDVTVVGAKSGRDGSPYGLGPVASRLVEHANTSILVARGSRETEGVKVLAPVDDSDGSLRTLEKLNQLIDLASAEVTLVHVVETPWLHAGDDQEWQGWEEEIEEQIDPQAQLEREFEREGEEILERARARLPGHTAVSTMIYRGLPADEILSEAETGGYDLIVVGPSGVRDLKHQMLGSVSSKIVWNAPCSVLVVRSPD